MTRRVLLTLVLIFGLPLASGAQTPAPAPSPQTPDETPEPAIRRWLDVQQLHFWSRFRFSETTDGRIMASTIEWQPQVRARLLFDPDHRYALNMGVSSGNQLIAGWNSTGSGPAAYNGDMNFKQLFVSAEMGRLLEGQVGGLYFLRGENTEITSYDNDGFIVGERVTFRRAEGALSQVAATVGYIGDYRTPNVFDRFKRMDEWNYGQLLVGVRAGKLANLSADYTYEDGRDILREGISIRMPRAVKLLTAVKLEAYQRVSDVTGQGFNISADVRPMSRLTMTGGVAHVDRHYGAPGYGFINADRFGIGTRFYSQGTFAVTRELSVGYFHGEAFNANYVLPIERRWEILVMFNPIATLKAKRVF